MFENIDVQGLCIEKLVEVHGILNKGTLTESRKSLLKRTEDELKKRGWL